MTEQEQREGARQFYNKWHKRGREDEDDRSYWLDLLSRVMGLENATDYVEFQKKVIVDGNTKRIDVYIPETKVLIEQKSLGISLDKKGYQSGGISLTPYEQAKRYNDNLPYEENARWILTSNFEEIWIYDMNASVPEPTKLNIYDLQTMYVKLNFLIKQDIKKLSHEMKVSLQAGDIVGLMYDAFLKQYKDPDDEKTLKSLNKLCVRIVFCLYAEDAGIFGQKDLFHDYLERFDAKMARNALKMLFKVLNQKPQERDKYLRDDDELLASFPYVNGGLFADEDIEIPPFTDELLALILKDASEEFDWSQISPTIFGAVFESTLNPETRRSGGMHYTSIENIHKVINPLFLDDLRQELDSIKSIEVASARTLRLKNFQKKLASLNWLDPACGSGNFLTETYICIRRIENEVINELQKGQISLGFENDNPIQVSISQFYGIEINDFAVTVAQTALWIAESQMMKETEDVVRMNLEFLPLKTNACIIEGNALILDWNKVIAPMKLNYIMGNPPFVGGMYMSEEQKSEIREIFDGVKGAGELDYVCGWYKKAAEYILGTKIRVAFVSTNSICQGSQVIVFWKYIIERFSIHIDYAYKTFIWNNETKGQAKVHCIIVGYSGKQSNIAEKKLYDEDNKYKVCEQISPYLTDTEVCFIEARSNPLCDVPSMRFGSMPRDGGGFVLSPEERKELIEKEPLAQKWIKPYIGAVEFLNKKERYCLWLVGAEPGEISKCAIVKRRVEHVREVRANSKAAGTRKYAATPTLFCQIAQPDSDYIIVPKTSSGKRSYVPLGFMDKDTIASDLVFLIPNAGLYEFGVLMSNVHNAWLRLVAGRLKSDFRYSKDIVYNNFVWCDPTSEQKKRIEDTARGILEARKLYPNSTLANMYDDVLMPLELRKAHVQNDIAVMQAYGFPIKETSESDCVAALMKMYQKKVSELACCKRRVKR